jgi:Helix-turn-helix domain of resolvase
VLIVEDWAEIRRLWKSEGVSISEIARVVGCSRNTVKAALASSGPPKISGGGRVRWLTGALGRLAKRKSAVGAS